MPFVSEINRWVSRYSEGTPERIVLEFLRDHGVGRNNAQPWWRISEILEGHGFSWRIQNFQQGLLRETREGDLYIGSNDHGRSRGYFLVADEEDADLVADWYRRRIAKEQERLQRIEDLVDQEWNNQDLNQSR